MPTTPIGCAALARQRRCPRRARAPPPGARRAPAGVALHPATTAAVGAGAGHNCVMRVTVADTPQPVVAKILRVDRPQ